MALLVGRGWYACPKPVSEMNGNNKSVIIVFIILVLIKFLLYSRCHGFPITFPRLAKEPIFKIIFIAIKDRKVFNFSFFVTKISALALDVCYKHRNQLLNKIICNSHVYLRKRFTTKSGNCVVLESPIALS